MREIKFKRTLLFWIRKEANCINEIGSAHMLIDQSLLSNINVKEPIYVRFHLNSYWLHAHMFLIYLGKDLENYLSNTFLFIIYIIQSVSLSHIGRPCLSHIQTYKFSYQSNAQIYCIVYDKHEIVWISVNIM